MANDEYDVSPYFDFATLPKFPGWTPPSDFDLPTANAIALIPLPKTSFSLKVRCTRPEPEAEARDGGDGGGK